MQNSLIIARILWPKNNFSEGNKTIKKVEKKSGVKKKWQVKKRGNKKKKKTSKTQGYKKVG